MTIYKILKINQLIKNHRIKFLGLWALNIFNQRFLSLYFDPVLACNLKCKMCYFTDKDYVSKMKGIMPEENLSLYANALFKNALKLQIGCGAEPTLFKELSRLIKLGKEYKIPYISLTTNGNLLNKEKINEYCNAGLDEFTISLHGVTKENYEFFMGKGEYEKLLFNLKLITEEKKRNPKLKLRINYTYNKDNFEDLDNFFDVYKDISIDILQLRPIQKIGNTAYQNFDLSSLKDCYSRILKKIKSIAKQKGVIVLSNSELNIKEKNKPDQSYLVPFTYCYVSPNYCWKKDFDFKTETFSEWSKRTNWKSKIFSNVLRKKYSLEKDKGTEKLNYSVDIN